MILFILGEVQVFLVSIQLMDGHSPLMKMLCVLPKSTDSSRQGTSVAVYGYCVTQKASLVDKS